VTLNETTVSAVVVAPARVTLKSVLPALPLAPSVKPLESLSRLMVTVGDSSSAMVAVAV